MQNKRYYVYVDKDGKRMVTVLSPVMLWVSIGLVCLTVGVKPPTVSNPLKTPLGILELIVNVKFKNHDYQRNLR